MVLLSTNFNTKKKYDLVTDEDFDIQIPPQNEEAFKTGITFQSKYIGTLDIPRPSTKVEIVAAMRRVRYEFKAKAIKKSKVNVTISLDGVKIQLRHKDKKKQLKLDESRQLVMQHAIYRIFYVSHDSQDLKIWSYIAREGGTNIFKCNVFKTYKKSQAMLIVRTIGQAFEVCHKLSETNGTEEDNNLYSVERVTELADNVSERDCDRNDLSLAINPSHSPSFQETNTEDRTEVSLPPNVDEDDQAESEVSQPQTFYHKIQLVRYQLDQQRQATQIAMAQIQLLKDQLAAETAARIEAQARTHYLLMNNRDILIHMSDLVKKIQNLELGYQGDSSSEDLDDNLKDPIFPQSTPPCVLECPFYSNNPYIQETSNNFNYDLRKFTDETKTPDSGLPEISSESLSSAFNVNGHFPNSENTLNFCKSINIHGNISPRTSGSHQIMSDTQVTNSDRSLAESVSNNLYEISFNCDNKFIYQRHSELFEKVEKIQSPKRSESLNIPISNVLTDNSDNDKATNIQRYFDLQNVHQSQNDNIDVWCEKELQLFAGTTNRVANVSGNTECPDILNKLNNNIPLNSVLQKFENNIAEGLARQNVMVNCDTDSPKRPQDKVFRLKAHKFTPCT